MTRTIADILTDHVCLIAPDDTLAHAAGLMVEQGSGFAVAVRDDRPAGLLTEADLVHIGRLRVDMQQTAVEGYLSQPVISVTADQDVYEALDTLIEHEVQQLVVVDGDGRVQGALILADILETPEFEDFLATSTISEAMNREFVTLRPTDAVAQAVTLMDERRIGCVVVVNDAGEAIGIFTRSDASRLLAGETDVSEPEMREVMHTPLLTMQADASLLEVLREMQGHALRHMVIADDARRPIGILTQLDVVRGLEGKRIQVLRQGYARTRAALQESRRLQAENARMRRIIEVSPSVLYHARWEAATGAFTGSYVSPAITAMLGYEEEECLAPGWWAGNLHPEDREAALSRMDELFRQGELTHRYRFRHKSGGWVWIQDQLRLIRDERGGPVEIIGAWQDITAYKEAEEAAAEQHLRNELILQTSMDGVIIADDNGDIVQVNPAYCAMVGYSEKELTSMNIAQLEALLTPREIGEKIAQMMQDGSARFETRHRHKDGHAIDLDVSIFVTRPKGSRPLVSAFVRDISRHKMREQLERDERHILEQIADREAGLSDVLRAICKAVQRHRPGMLASILLLDQEGRHLLHGAAPDLPAEFCRMVDGGEIGPAAGSCGTAAYRRERVIVSDIAHDPLWAGYKDLALQFGLAACWSEPVINREGEVLGTFAMYYPEPREPAAEDLALIERMAALAAHAITHKRATEALAEREREYRTLVESTPLGIIVHEDGIVRYANPAAARMAGAARPQELVGRNVFDYVPEEEHRRIRERIAQVIAGGDPGATELQVRRLDGGRFWAELRSLRTTFRGRPAVQTLMLDITQHKEAEERLAYLSYYDALTGLPNRRLFHDRVRQAIALARREQSSLALMFLDLDRFKFINDTLGHAHGDAVLKVTGARLREVLRVSDSAARMGGDEFAVILQGVDGFEAMHVAGKIRDALHRPHRLGEQDYVLDTSIGIAMFPQDGVDAEILLRRADTAMYHAKQKRSHIHYFSADMEREAARRVVLEQDLARAIEQEQLQLYYQGQYAIQPPSRSPPPRDPGKPEFHAPGIIAVEGLLRWPHPQLGLVSPAEFIPLAEETGLIWPLTRWVLREAARQALAWEQAGIRPGAIGVNLSAVLLMQKGLAADITEWLREVGARPEWIEIELTETAVMREPETAIRIMRELADAAISIIIDDFGTGYSSLAYLKSLPAEWLKIDMSFIRDLPDDDEDAAIVRSTIAMAHALGMRTIAEGVESEAQLEFLRNEGCDAVQGYLLSRPLPSDQMTERLQQLRDEREAEAG